MDELFWNKVSAIGTCLGALATFIAVVVALYQTQLTNKKKLKLKFNDPVTIVNPNTGQQLGDYIGITIINIGNREVIIDDWSILPYNQSKGRYKIMTEMQGLLSQKLPYKLKIEEKLDLYYEKKAYLRLVTDWVDKNNIKLDKKIKFQILDSTNKSYIIESDKTISEYSNESKERRLKK